ncbi:MAG: hypothetical protein ACNA7J_07175 [Wenzhouxiangella sp.]
MNFLTDLGTPFPSGCLSIEIPDQPRTRDSVLIDQTIAVPSLNSAVLDASVRLTIWRAACADEEFSVVLVRMRQLGNPADPALPFVLVPQVFAEAGNQTDFPMHEAQLVEIPGSGNAGASGRLLSTENTTWMLAVNPIRLTGNQLFLPADYNDAFTVEFDWSSFSPSAQASYPFVLDRFDPQLDPPQFEQKVLNGRYSGQWIKRDLERQGLVLQIGEQIDQNFVFAIFFTYLNGQPVWVTGNSTPAAAQPGPITINPMIMLEDGLFITADQHQPAEDISTTVAGSITITPIDCNNIQVDFDFRPIGQGVGSMQLERIIRIAGYDCNPWSE